MHDATSRQLAVCHGETCTWQGRRTWPSPERPCPRCGGRVWRVVPGRASNSRSDRREVPWAEGANQLDVAVCARLLPNPTNSYVEVGRRCGRPAVDMLGPAGEEARCAVHKGVDKRTATNRANREVRNRILWKNGRGLPGEAGVTRASGVGRYAP